MMSKQTGDTGVSYFLRLGFLKGPVGASLCSRPIGSEYFSRWLAGEFEFPASFWFDLNEILRFTGWIRALFPFNHREEIQQVTTKKQPFMLLSIRGILAGISFCKYTCSARPSILAREDLLASKLANCANVECAVWLGFQLHDLLALVNTVSFFFKRAVMAATNWGYYWNNSQIFFTGYDNRLAVTPLNLFTKLLQSGRLASTSTAFCFWVAA